MRPETMTLRDKCRLLGGASTWRTHAIGESSIPAVKMSDGPNGVRGDGLGARSTPGVVLPVGIALGATWDPGLIGRLGELLGDESIRRGAHVLLAPTINLQRTPIGGRVFECYSEDPELTARLAVAFVRGVQSRDVGVTVKHFVLNDTEVDRMSVDVRVDDRALRELYLRPFEAAVVEAGAWGIMSAYNRYNGDHCAESATLLTNILREEWGFDGFVVSDWFGSHDTVAAVTAGLTVPMPGPNTIYGDALELAVDSGAVDESVVDELVTQVIRLIERTHAGELSSERPERTVDDPGERALCRTAVAAGAVLVKNNGALPLAPSMTIALIGPNASDTRIMGGGSSSLAPIDRATILEVLPDRVATVEHHQGVRIDRLPAPATGRFLRTPDGQAGLRVDYRNGHDVSTPIVTTDTSPTSMLRFFGSTPVGVDPDRFSIVISGTYIPEVSGEHLLSAVITGPGTIDVGDVRVLDDPKRTLPRGPLFFGMASAEQTATIDLEAGVPVDVAITTFGRGGFAGVRLGFRPPDPGDLIEQAVAAAAAADRAIVVVGTNDEWETEGEDRSTIRLPGDQDELVARVAAANPNTVVLINAGAPVSMPWIDDVSAVLITYFGGYEMANGVVDVLLGDVDPGGRLPITYPTRLEDCPAWASYHPVDGVQTYAEGLLMGYRGTDAAGTTPLFAFGHGLSYGEAAWGEATMSAAQIAADASATVTVPIASTGDRPVTVVVQAYLAALDSPVPRPPKELAVWAKHVIEPGQTIDVRLEIAGSMFRRWDVDSHRFVVDPGSYEIVLAASALDVRQRLPLSIDVGPAVE